jgi:hypothetical protein
MIDVQGDVGISEMASAEVPSAAEADDHLANTTAFEVALADGAPHTPLAPAAMSLRRGLEAPRPFFFLDDDLVAPESDHDDDVASDDLTRYVEPVAPAASVQADAPPETVAPSTTTINTTTPNVEPQPLFFTVAPERIESRAVRPLAPARSPRPDDDAGTVEAVRVRVGEDHLLVPTSSLQLIVEFDLYNQVPFTQPWICGLGLHAGVLYPVLQIGRQLVHLPTASGARRKGLLLDLEGLRCLLDTDAVVGFGRCRIVGASHFQGWSAALPPEFLIDGATAEREVLPTVNGAAIKAMLHG